MTPKDAKQRLIISTQSYLNHTGAIKKDHINHAPKIKGYKVSSESFTVADDTVLNKLGSSVSQSFH